MTKNDITRGLIDFAVSQCLKNIKEDPYRSIRRLADLGRQFAKGRFQEELFSLFQRLLLNEDGPYYEMLKQLVSSVDTDSLKTLGINIGYNSWDLRQLPGSVRSPLKKTIRTGLQRSPFLRKALPPS